MAVGDTRARVLLAAGMAQRRRGVGRTLGRLGLWGLWLAPSASACVVACVEPADPPEVADAEASSASSAGGSGGTRSVEESDSSSATDDGTSSGTTATTAAASGGSAGAASTSVGSAGAASTSVGSAGAAGAGGAEEVPWEPVSCTPESPTMVDDCPYPEYLGGSGLEGSCGVTPGAWYPLGASEPAPWPERAEDTPEGLGEAAVPQLILADDGQAFLRRSRCDVSRWDGAAWVALPPPDFEGLVGTCNASELTLTADGSLYMAFQTQSEGAWSPIQGMYLMRLEDEAWQLVRDFGELELGDTTGYHLPRVAVDRHGYPTVLWGDDDLLTTRNDLIRWNGADWEHMDIGFLPRRSRRGWDYQLAMTSDDRPVITWLDVSDAYSHYPLRRMVMEWDGEQWLLLGDPYNDLAPLGEQQSVLHLVDGEVPTFTLPDGDGFIVAAWSSSGWEFLAPDEQTLEAFPDRDRSRVSVVDGDIRLEYFENCQWVGVAASNRGGGVSNSEVTSRKPSVAYDDGRVCVTWSEGGAAMLRCHDLDGT